MKNYSDEEIKNKKEFFLKFQNLCYEKWKDNAEPKENYYGCKILSDTKWLEGYLPKEIKNIEKIISRSLPDDVKMLLSLTKGLSKDQACRRWVDSSSTEIRYGNQWKLSLEYLNENYKKDLLFHESNKTWEILKNEFLVDNTEDNFYLLPIYSHRYILCDERNITDSVVFSIYDDDIIIYGVDLWIYLQNEFCVLVGSKD
jgi:hypothetical protein